MLYIHFPSSSLTVDPQPFFFPLLCAPNTPFHRHGSVSEEWVMVSFTGLKVSLVLGICWTKMLFSYCSMGFRFIFNKFSGHLVHLYRIHKFNTVDLEAMFLRQYRYGPGTRPSPKAKWQWLSPLLGPCFLVGALLWAGLFRAVPNKAGAAESDEQTWLWCCSLINGHCLFSSVDELSGLHLKSSPERSAPLLRVDLPDPQDWLILLWW